MNQIKECALAECLGVVNLKQGPSFRGLEVKGIYSDEIEARIRSLLEPPSSFFASVEKDFGDRVTQKLKELNELNPNALSMSNDIFIQFLEGGKVRMTAANTQNDTGESIVRRTIDRWQFWIQREGYDITLDCCCCFDKYNADQGIQCRNGHFYCSEGSQNEQCFSLSVQSQILQVQFRDGYSLCCPNCNDPYDSQAVAAHLPANVCLQELPRKSRRWPSIEKICCLGRGVQ